MRIRYEQDGGMAFIPGLAGPITVDTAGLPQEEAEKLESLVAEARFFDEAPPAGEVPGTLKSMRDQRSYDITVERDGERRSLHLADPVPVQLQPLVRELQGRLKHRRD